MLASRDLSLFAASFATLVLLGGCDPKATGPEGGGNPGTPDLPGVDDVQSAEQIGSMIGLHLDLIHVALDHSAEFQAGSPGAASRSIFTNDCVTVTTVDQGAPELDVDLTGCVDVRGTAYRGGGALFPIEGMDGYYFWPYGAVEDKIIATNDGNSDLNYTFESGNLQFMFVAGGIEVGSFVRHSIAGATVTVTWDDVLFSDASGGFDMWPAVGGLLHVAWDGVGVFDVEFNGTATAHFTLGGYGWSVALTDGSVNSTN